MGYCGAMRIKCPPRASLFLVPIAVLVLSACALAPPGPVGNSAVPQPAKPVDLQRYAGIWFEMGRYEASFQRGCEAVTADYALKVDGSVKVLNSCRQGAPDGPLKTATGRAKVVEGSQNAKLKVSFFGPFYGDYWILDHADDYTWSIVGEPSGRYLWFLTRIANPSDTTRATITNRARELGYNLQLVRPTQH